jgi:hypothetical protein
MKKLFTLLFISVLCISFYGCATSDKGPKLIDGKPEWYYNPTLSKGEIGGVGVSGIHVDGKTGQKRLAVERALASIARQMGVKVQSFSNLRSETEGGSTGVSGESVSFFTVEGQNVRAYIKQIWEDPYTKELYVWMVTK